MYCSNRIEYWYQNTIKVNLIRNLLAEWEEVERTYKKKGNPYYIKRVNILKGGLSVSDRIDDWKFFRFEESVWRKYHRFVDFQSEQERDERDRYCSFKYTARALILTLKGKEALEENEETMKVIEKKRKQNPNLSTHLQSTQSAQPHLSIYDYLTPKNVFNAFIAFIFLLGFYTFFSFFFGRTRPKTNGGKKKC